MSKDKDTQAKAEFHRPARFYAAHYRVLAEVVRGFPSNMRLYFASKLADRIEQENDNFKRAMFYQQAGVDRKD